jgi:hypothetical protein
LEKEQAEAKMASKKSLDEKIKKANSAAQEESKDDFVIRESKQEDDDEPKDKAKRMFLPDFDIDEVPPLE